jgi:tetratricopeptide (TPR) repeat protein
MSEQPPERAEIEAELARLLASPDFEKNHGASAFLKFVVEETLEGRGDRLKAFTIATQALDRKDDFDSQNNSAVRVQALRLRQLLKEAYEGPGEKAPVRIHIRTGTYKPTFERVGAPQPASAALVVVPPSAGPGPKTAAPKSPFVRRFAGALGLSLSALVVALTVLMTKPASPPGSRSGNAPPLPSLRIDRPDNGKFADLAQALEVEFSAFDNIIVRKPEAAGPQAASATNAYALGLRSLGKDFVAELVRLSDGAIVWAGQFATPAETEALVRQARALAQTLGDAYGVIDVDALRLLNNFDGMPRGFNCTLNAFTFLKSQSVDRLRVARECLETAVRANPRDDDARAMLAILLVQNYLYAPPEGDPAADLARAEKLAQEAFELAPHRARSFFARFLTEFAAKRYDEAFAAARTALSLNGNSTLFARVIGAAYVMRGDIDAGMALLSPLVDRTNDSSAALGATALGHDLQGEKREAAQLLARPGASERALALILQLGLCGDAACARERRAELKRNFPGIAADIGAALDRMGATEKVKTRLLAGLRDAD